MTTEAALVNSLPVLGLASETLHARLPPGSRTVSASVPPNTQIVQIQFTASKAAEARDGAQAVASAFLKYRAGQSTANREARLKNLNQQAEAVTASLAKASAAATQVKPPPDATQQVQLYANQLGSLNTAISTIKATGADPGFIVRPAQTPTSPSTLNPWLFVVVGALIGLGGAIAFAVWRTRGDDRIHGTLVTSIADLPILTHVVAMGDPVSFASDEDNAQVREAFRDARAALLATADAPKSITVAGSDTNGDAAGFVAVNLGRSLASAGYRVAIVSTSRCTGVERLFDIDNEAGVVDVLTQAVRVEACIRRIGNIDVLPYGSAEEDRPDLLANPSFAQLVVELTHGRDFVFVGADPVSAPGGLTVALATDCLVLTCTDGQTTHSQVARDVLRAHELGVSVLGTVLVNGGSWRRLAQRRYGSPPLRAYRKRDKAHGAAEIVNLATSTNAVPR